MARGANISSNLPQLQNLIKRDPVAYKEEFLQQWNHYNSIRQIFNVHPEEQAHHFRELVAFLAQVATCYPTETAQFPSHISSLLLENFGSLSPDTRKTLIQNLVILRNKDVISSVDLLRCLFPLLPRTSSPTLRTFIRKTILSDIRTANMRSKNHKLNRAVQAMLFDMVERGMDDEVVGDKGKLRTSYGPTTNHIARNGEEAMWAVILTKELWRKGTWTSAKAVSILSLGVFHPVTKVQSVSAHFFLGSDDEKQDSDDEDQEELDVRTLHHRREINKKTRGGDKKMQKKLDVAKKKHHGRSEDTVNFPAVQLLNDPQTFAEKLYDSLNRYDRQFSLDHKILLMQLLSRVMGVHQLCVLGFYTYIVKYLAHRQLRVPSILAALAQSVHELTPPDAIIPVIRKLVQEFVHPGVGSEVVAAGLNAVREICKRQPWSMEEELLGDLIEYRKSRDKTVTAAARGLLQLYREVNPGMLKRRERGKDASMKLASGVQALPFGHRMKPAVDVEGLVLLEDHLQKLAGEGAVAATDDDDESAWHGWDVESDSSDGSSGTWMDVDDAGYVDISGDESSDAEDPLIRTSTLATTKILTPADFALLNDLRIQEAGKAVEHLPGFRAKRKRIPVDADRNSTSVNQQTENFSISESDILGPRKKVKADYAERMASVQKGREGREKFRSNKGKVNKGLPSSSTNREKARNKPIMMILSSGAVSSKKKISLRQKQQKLRAHIDRAKKARR